jgi:hypothetical protein
VAPAKLLCLLPLAAEDPLYFVGNCVLALYLLLPPGELPVPELPEVVVLLLLGELVSDFFAAPT